MAGTYDQLKRLQEYTQELYMVADTEFRQILNSDTGGTLVSVSRPKDGDFFTGTFWGSETDLVRLEAPNVLTTANEKELKRIQQVDIKTAITTDKIIWQRIANRWTGLPPDDQAAKGAERIIRLMMKTKINSLVSSLVAFFARGLLTTGKDTVIEEVIDDQGGAAAGAGFELDISKIISAKMKFGDLYGEISGVILHSGAFTKMQLRNLSQYQQLFTYGTNFVTVTSEGLPMYVTDNPALTYTTGGVTRYRTLLLTPGAATIFENNDFDDNVDVSNDQTWIGRSYKAETTFNIGIKAGTWANTANVHPKIGTTAATGKLIGLHTDTGVLDNPASWARVGTTGSENRGVTKKEMPGVMLISQ